MKQNTFLGHPLELKSFSLIHILERFPMQGIRMFLLAYMLQVLTLTQPTSVQILGTFSSFFCLSLLSSWIADTFLGTKKIIIFAYGLMILGSILLLFDSISIYISVGLLLAGGAINNNNFYVMFSEIYGKNDNRRDSGFVIMLFIGSVVFALSLFLSFILRDHLQILGITYIICLVSSLILFLKSDFKKLGNINSSLIINKPTKILVTLGIFLLSLLLVFNVITLLTFSISAIVLGTIGYFILKPLSEMEIPNIKHLGKLLIGYFLYYVLQLSSLHIINFNKSELVNTEIISDWKLPIYLVNLIFPILVTIWCPILLLLWLYFNNKFSKKSKLIVAMITNIPVFVIITLSFYFSEDKVSIWWMILCMNLLAIGSVYSYPIAQSAITQLVPSRMAATVMSALPLIYVIMVYVLSFIPPISYATKEGVVLYAAICVILSAIVPLVYSKT